ncbi:MAG: RIP metalloprotease RseP [Gammaproteobacteria bacterium]|nr:RIP metalloprotease RseP [Gammaproteobacteria bacterium]NNC97836.1 RIP metalloprotease RseP [Gammaproteobacteria bacterium]
MLPQLLIAIPAFLIAITVLVAIHEYGHYWVAKKFGVMVKRFSIGFGRPLWRKKPENSDTEFVISSLPLGGYVKMLDERFDDNIPAGDLPRAFTRQSPWSRIWILLAGPAANFIFAILAFYLLFMIGVSDYTTYVTPTTKDSPAATAGLQSGDRVTHVNGHAVRAFEDLVLNLVDGVISSDELNLTVERNNISRRISVAVSPEVAKMDDSRMLLQGLGIQIWLPEYSPEIAAIQDDTAAAQAGLLKGDKILALNNQKVTSVQSFISDIQKMPNQSVSLLVERHNTERRVTLKVSEKLINDKNIGIIGASLRMPQDVFEQMRTKVRYGPIASFVQACKSTYAMSALSLKMFREMVLGKVSVKNLSGPFSIAEQAGTSIQLGLDYFIKFLALISIALGIVNLLPVPMLDGGQIVFNLMELVKGSPVSLRTELLFQYAGILSIVLIMGLAIYNDIERLLF